MEDNVIYPNSPLKEVVFEVRFKGLVAVECHRDEFYREIAEEYPNVLVPHIDQNTPPALQAYKFEKEDKSAGIMTAINKISYYSREYPGYKKFRKETLRILKIFNKIFKLKKITRTGWRYINIMPYAREEDIIPLKRFLNLDLHLPLEDSDSFKNIDVKLHVPIKADLFVVIIRSIINFINKQEALVLDLDYSKNKDLEYNKIEDYIKESHGFARDFFEEIITEQYREYLKGEVI